MLVEPPLVADTLVEPWFSSLRQRRGAARLFDARTHLGCADPDGSCFDVHELAAALAVVDARAVVFPLVEPRRRGPRMPGIHLIFVAAAVARTPGLLRPELEATQ
jgi:hypothetical protein